LPWLRRLVQGFNHKSTNYLKTKYPDVPDPHTLCFPEHLGTLSFLPGMLLQPTASMMSLEAKNPEWSCYWMDGL
jgi:hypothetical protein